MSAQIVTPVSAGPLTPEHHRELAQAKERSVKIRTAARVAAFNGWVTALIAASSALFTMFSFSIVSLLVTVALAAVAYNEFRGRDRLLAFDPGAATLLGWNQLGLLAMITIYCGWMLYTSLTNPNAISPELRQVMDSVGELDELVRYITLVFYGLVIGLSAIFQGLNALYYFTRRKHIEAYVRETPEWVRSVQRATAGA